MILLPTHPTLKSLDPLGILDDVLVDSSLHDEGVKQADILAALLSKVARDSHDAAKVLPDVIEEIAYSIHTDGAMDTGYLRECLATWEQSILGRAVEQLATSALSLSALFEGDILPVLGADSDDVALGGRQVDSLLAHQFLGTFFQPPGNEWGLPCFTSWFASNPHHVSAVNGYIRILLDHFAAGGYTSGDQTFRYTRFTSAHMPDPASYGGVPDFTIRAVVEESEPSDLPDEGTFVLVSAHSQPGPGPSGTHEERLQASSPSLSMSSLVSPLLSEDAAVVTSCIPVHSIWKGHNRTARLVNVYKPETRPRRHYIIADALELDVLVDSEDGSLKDLQGDRLDREVRKLYTGFAGAAQMSETGRKPLIEAPAWGCRSFGGNILVKAMCMMIAAALADVSVQLILVQDRVEEIEAVHQIIHRKLTAPEMWAIIASEEAKTCRNTEELRDCLIKNS